MKLQFTQVHTQQQIDSLCAIAKRVWHLTYDGLLPSGQVDYMLEKFQSDAAVKDQMANQNYRYYLMVCDGQDAGFIGFSPRYEGREELFLSKLYLLPEFRGQGVAGKALALAEEEARQEGLMKIRLTVNKGNAHAAQVYKHYGFRTVEEAETDIGGGFVMDDFIMVKELDGE